MSEIGAATPASGAALQAVIFLVGHFQRDMAVARFHLGHAGGGIGDELDRHGVEIGLAAPVVGLAFRRTKAFRSKLSTM
jgi:hypothetical protein